MNHRSYSIALSCISSHLSMCILFIIPPSLAIIYACIISRLACLHALACTYHHQILHLLHLSASAPKKQQQKFLSELI